jgi:Fe-S-cluster containining protein
MTIRFTCTGCGQCCHDTAIPLLIGEAQDWVDRGGQMAISAEMLPSGQGTSGRLSDWVMERSLPARSGTATIRIHFTLFAVIDGPCHHLTADSGCAIYADRPIVCRTYPAEVTELPDRFPILVSAKACPPEAWQGPVLQQGTRLVEGEERAAVLAFQAGEIAQQSRLARITEILGVTLGASPIDGVALAMIPPAAWADLEASNPLPTGSTRYWTALVQHPERISFLKRDCGMRAIHFEQAGRLSKGLDFRFSPSIYDPLAMMAEAKRQKLARRP